MSSQSDVEEDDVVTEFYGPARLNDDSSVHQGTPFDNLTSQSLEPLDEEGTLHDDNMNEDIEALKNAWMNELVRTANCLVQFKLTSAELSGDFRVSR